MIAVQYELSIANEKDKLSKIVTASKQMPIHAIDSTTIVPHFILVDCPMDQWYVYVWTVHFKWIGKAHSITKPILCHGFCTENDQ